MTYRTILVHVDDSEAARTRIGAAVALAQRFGSTLSAVFLHSEFTPPDVVGDGVVIPISTVQAFLDERDQVTGKASNVARKMLEEAVRGTEIRPYWLDVEGDNTDALIACSRRHDLIILPPEMKAVFGQDALAASDIGMAAGGPLLIVGSNVRPTNIGKKILVAWKESRESARVLRDAWPLLSAADEVHFLSVSRRGEPYPDEVLQRDLEAHGCKRTEFLVSSEDESGAGFLIRRHAMNLGVDLIVLGLYGHSRFRELMLGGVSRDLLNDMPIPLFVSH